MDLSIRMGRKCKLFWRGKPQEFLTLELRGKTAPSITSEKNWPVHLINENAHEVKLQAMLERTFHCLKNEQVWDGRFGRWMKSNGNARRGGGGGKRGFNLSRGCPVPIPLPVRAAAFAPLAILVLLFLFPLFLLLICSGTTLGSLEGGIAKNIQWQCHLRETGGSY